MVSFISFLRAIIVKLCVIVVRIRRACENAGGALRFEVFELEGQRLGGADRDLQPEVRVSGLKFWDGSHSARIEHVVVGFILDVLRARVLARDVRR